jgi:hypothetical protein
MGHSFIPPQLPIHLGNFFHYLFLYPLKVNLSKTKEIKLKNHVRNVFFCYYCFNI